MHFTPTFSLCFNGKLEGYIKGGRGILQGDPLSPYVFIICMDVLSKKLDIAAIKGLIAYHPRCKRLRITHLSFVDYLMVFTTADSSSLLGIKSVFDDFYLVSCLSVSYGKSKM